MKFLQSSWMICLIGCVTYLGCTLAFLNPKKIQPVRAQEHDSEEHDADHKPAVLTGPSWEYNNPEVDQIVSELKTERATLTEQTKRLTEWEARLRAEQKELTQATQSVFRLQQEFDRTVTRVKEEETANLKRLAKLYTTMTPEGAVAVMKQQEDELILKVLVNMKEEETAPILELMAKGGPADAKRVATLTERLRLVLYRQPGNGKP